MDVSSLVHLFFNNPTFSDITMVINDEPLYLHKIILAQVNLKQTLKQLTIANVINSLMKIRITCKTEISCENR